ncbi:MAG: (d)CMP kinase [Dehalococcoidia bacterium]
MARAPGPVPSPIAIDGPAASGKTTVGRALARELGFGFLDTGAMYRAFTVAALEAAIPPSDVAGCEALAARLAMTTEVSLDTRILLDGRDVTGRLRDDDVESAVSGYSAIPGVREAMVQRQRDIAAGGRVILAGRDIGTVVLPDAPVKLFLTASSDERARRRSAQNAEAGEAGSVAKAQADISGRDQTDSTRSVSPMVPADDALVLDSTALGEDAVLARARELIAARALPLQAIGEADGTPRSPGARATAASGWMAKLVPPFYWGTQYPIRLILFIVARWTVSRSGGIPAEGPVVFVSNHLNFIDPPILATALGRPRRVRFMAKSELFKGPIGLLVKLHGAFPVRRFDADLAAMLAAERILRQGGSLGMFPEGTRSRSWQMAKPHPGTALIALRAGATVVPCGVTGTEKIKGVRVFLRRPAIVVRVGVPIAVERVKRPSDTQVSQLTDAIDAAIRALLPAAYGGTYTGSSESSERQL